MSCTALLFITLASAVVQDTTVVRSRGAGVWKTVKLVEELRIGVLEGDDSHIFGSVLGMAVARDGSMFVADMPGQRIRLYGREEKLEWDARARHTNQRLSPGDASYGVTVPAVKPAYHDFSVGEDGRIWVRRYVAAQKRTDLPPPRGTNPPPPISWREPPTFDVFEPGGRFLGTVVLPHRTYLWVRRGNSLWGTTRGALDETYIVRYRLEVTS
ncbi:MAG: hypothetical protein WEE89_15215 [Gemmatimonadota bacterium]